MSEQSRVPQWSEISGRDEFKALSPEQQEQTRSTYFDRVIAPSAPADQLESIRSEFDKRTMARPVEPEAPEQEEGFWAGVGNTVRGAGERVGDLAGGFVDAVGAAAEASPTGIVGANPTRPSIRPQKILNREERKQVGDMHHGIAEGLRSTDFGYDPGRYTLEGAKGKFGKGDYLGALTEGWAAGMDTLGASAPDMVAAATGAGIGPYIMARSGEIANERAKNKGMERATSQELAEAAPFAAASAVLERILPKRLASGQGELTEEAAREISGKAIRHVLKKAGSEGVKDFAVEGGTEFIQEGVLEYLGENYGTDVELNARDAFARGAEAAILGGIGGGTLGTAKGAYEGVSDVRKPRIATPDDIEAELDGDVDVESELANLEAELEAQADDIGYSPGAESSDPAAPATRSEWLDTEGVNFDAEAQQPVPGASDGSEPISYDQFNQMQPGEQLMWQPEDVEQSAAVEFEGVAGTLGGREFASVVVDGRKELVPLDELKRVPEYREQAPQAQQPQPQPEAPEGTVNFERPEIPETGGLELAPEQEVYDGGLDFSPSDLPQDTSARDNLASGVERLIDQHIDKSRDDKLPEGLKDPRLLRDEYRARLGQMTDELTKGGGVGYVRDENDRITGRTPSTNPDWFKKMDGLVTTDEARTAVEKAVVGKKLGPRQAIVVQTIMDEIQQDRESMVPARIQERTRAIMSRDSKRIAESLIDPELALPESDPANAAVAELVADVLERGYSRDKLQSLIKQHSASGQNPLPKVLGILQSEGVFSEQRNRNEVRPGPDNAGSGSRNSGSESTEGAQPADASGDSPGIPWRTNPITAEERTDSERELAALLGEPESKPSQEPEPADNAGSSVSEAPESQTDQENLLESYTEQDITDREAAKADAPAQEQKAQVDREREEFGLDGGTATVTGSNDSLQKPQGGDMFASTRGDKSAKPSASKTKASTPAGDLPKILTDSRKKTLLKMAKEQGVKRSSPGYAAAMDRLGDEYEREVDKAQAGLTFEQFNELNSDSPESLNRQAYDGLREEYGITDAETVDIDTAAGEADTSPTEAQKEAGNYRLGHIKVQGLDISVENPKGSERSGTDPDGNKWSVTMNSHYGYIKSSVGADGEHVDVFVGPEPESQRVYIVDQVNPDGSFDEHKVMVGYRGKLAATKAYKDNYTKGWKVGPVTSMSMDEFKSWLKDGDNTKPLNADHFAGAKKKAKNPARKATESDSSSDILFSVSGDTPRRLSGEGDTEGLKTGTAITFDFIHNTESATDIFGVPEPGAPFGREYDPSGRYVIVTRDKNSVDTSGNLISGTLTFDNPMVVETDGTSWKKELSEKYDGKTGKDLSLALIGDGYDGVVTVEGKGRGRHISETLDLTTFDPAIAKFRGGETNSSKSVTEKAAQAVIDRIKSSMAADDTEIIQVSTFDDMPEGVKRGAKKMGFSGDRVKGVYYNGAVYLNRSSMPDAEAVERTILHELYGHHGIKTMFGPEARQAMGRLYLRVGGIKGVRELAKKHGISLERYIDGAESAVASGKLSREDAQSILADELLAHIAENNSPGVVRALKEFVGAIRSWLRANGFVKLSRLGDTDLMYLLKQARQAVNEGRVTGQQGVYFDLAGIDSSPETAPAFSMVSSEARRVIGDDPVLAGWTMLAQNDDAFQLPTSDKQSIEDIFNELEGPGGIQIVEAEELAMQMEKYGPEKSWRIITPQGKRAAIYEKGDSVWIDVSALDQGQNGKRVYNAVANYAHNNGKVFVGDPDGLSDVAQTRRLENMISSALKFGTTGHLWPHANQVGGNSNVDMPTIDWKDGDDAHNLRQMIDASYDATEKQFPKIKDLVYNPETDQFVDSETGEVWDGERFDEEAATLRGLQNTGRARGPLTAGRTTLERAVLSRTLSRGTREEVSRILERFGQLGSERLAGPNAPLYSVDKEPRPSAGVSRSGVEQTETPAFKKWFGDSKVVDKNGDPLVVYHGTTYRDITEFVPQDMDHISGQEVISRFRSAQKENRPYGYMDFRAGSFFSPSSEYAGNYTRDSTGVMYPVYIKAESPVYMDMATGEVTGPKKVTPDALILTQNGRINEVAVIDPTQIKSATGNRGTFDPNDPDIRFSVSDDSPAFAAPQEGKLYGIPKDALLRKLTDKMRPLLQTQREIEKASGSSISEELDAYRMEEAFHGKTENDLRKLRERFIEPLVDKMAEHGISQEELDMFLWARHAPERNAQVAKINPDMPDGGSGMTDAQAKQVLAKAKETGKLSQMVELSSIVYQMQKRKQELLAANLVDEGELNAWNDNYKYYVPLKGRADDESGKSYPKIGKGFNVRGKESLRALGRRTQPESPVLHSIMDTTQAVIRSRKNEVANTFLDLVEANPNPDYWNVYTDENPKQEPRLFKNAKGEEVRQAAVMDKSKFFVVKRKGKEHYIDLNDELLLRAMQNMGPEPLKGVMAWAGAASRFLSTVNTSLNPEFVITNAVRDIQTAVVNVLAEQDIKEGRVKGEAIAKKMAKGAPKAAYAIRMSLAGKKLKGDAGEWQKYFDMFRDDGAKTGWFDAKDIEGQKKDIAGMLSMAQKDGKGRLLRTKKVVGEFIENTNSSIENAVRLSAYRNAVEAGVSRKKAAELAKNLTVNFNRKGEWGNTINALYMFYNASVQGTMTFARAMGTFKDVDGKKKLNTAQKVGLAAAGAAYGLAMLNREMAGEDDDGENYYDKVPEWVKERNIVIMKSIYGGEPGTYFKIPLPYGYNIFHVVGTQTEAMTQGKTGIGEGAMNIAKAAVGSFAPLSISTSDETGNSALRTIAPTIAKPWVDLAYNENFFGGPIYRENFPFGAKKADASLFNRSTPEFWKNTAKFMNEATGGGTYLSGWMDVNPDSLNYLYEYFTGAAGAFAGRTINAAEKIASGVELEDREIPFKRQIMGELSPYADVSTFYDRRELAARYEAEWKSLTGRERVEFYKEHGKKVRLKGMAEDTAKQMSGLNKRRDRIEANVSLSAKQKDERLKRIEKQKKRLADRFNRVWPED